MHSIIINGFLTGLILQLAIGPVFIYITNIVIQKSLYDGLSAVLAAAVADYLYILLAISGVGRFLENSSFKKLFGIISSIVLIAFGSISILTSGNNPGIDNIPVITGTESLIESFVTTFILTISSPLTILFWTGLFTAKSLELNLSRRELYVFGISAGFTTILFLGVSAFIISVLRSVISDIMIYYTNIFVGIILVFYGIWRLPDIFRMKDNKIMVKLK
jgi:arginine exporter protein ArgO